MDFSIYHYVFDFAENVFMPRMVEHPAQMHFLTDLKFDINGVSGSKSGRNNIFGLSEKYAKTWECWKVVLILNFLSPQLTWLGGGGRKRCRRIFACQQSSIFQCFTSFASRMIELVLSLRRSFVRQLWIYQTIFWSRRWRWMWGRAESCRLHSLVWTGVNGLWMKRNGKRLWNLQTWPTSTLKNRNNYLTEKFLGRYFDRDDKVRKSYFENSTSSVRYEVVVTGEDNVLFSQYLFPPK